MQSDFDIFSTCGIKGRAPIESAAFQDAAMMGILLGFKAMSPFHRKRSLVESVDTFRTAQQMGQLKCYFNDYGECVGYVAWAMLGPDVHREFIAGKVRRLDSIEWNEGGSPWVVDFLVRPGSLHYVIGDLRKLFSKQGCVGYVRAQNGRLVLRRWMRRLNTSAAQ